MRSDINSFAEWQNNNQLQALNLYGCFRLGARIYDLKKAGFDIDSRLVHENGVQYAEYSMRAE